MPKMSEDYMEKRRYEILEAAKKVFTEKGFSGTTMTDLVDATGLSRGGLYHHFSNTDEVFQAILNEHDKEVVAYFEKLSSDYQTIWDGIDFFLNELETSLEKQNNGFAPTIFEYFIVGRHDEERMKFLNKRFEQATTVIARFLEKGIERNEFTAIQPLKTIALFLVGVLDSLNTHAFAIGFEKANIKGQIEGLRIYLKQVLGFN